MLRIFGALLAILFFSNSALADFAAGVAAAQEGDYGAAHAEWSALAENGDARSQYHLGTLYFSGAGMMRDYGKALEWFERAADQGDADAQHMIGVMYTNGQGVRQNYATAIEWYEKAVAQDHPQATHQMAMMYHYNQGIPMGGSVKPANWMRLEARRLFEQAAAMGVLASVSNLATIYRDEGNLEEAVKLFTQAAEKGYGEARYNLGVMYANGIGVEQSRQLAEKWYVLAALQGVPEAQYNLAQSLFLNQDGPGVRKIQAHMWANLAVASSTAWNAEGGNYGHKEGVERPATMLRDKLAEELSEEELMKSSRLAAGLTASTAKIVFE